jgi:hypothetical protein
MDFCDLDSPWGHVDRAREVLEFLAQTLTWPRCGEEITLNFTQHTGMLWILLACAETLEKAEKEASNVE